MFASSSDHKSHEIQVQSILLMIWAWRVCNVITYHIIDCGNSWVWLRNRNLRWILSRSIRIWIITTNRQKRQNTQKVMDWIVSKNRFITKTRQWSVTHLLSREKKWRNTFKQYLQNEELNQIQWAKVYMLTLPNGTRKRGFYEIKKQDMCYNWFP